MRFTLIVLTLVTIVNFVTSLLNQQCLDCICQASTGCDTNKKCHNAGPNQYYCGPYQISWAYWADGGKPGDTGLPHDFEECLNQKDCAEEAIVGYMNKWQKDCNRDGVIDCLDYAAIHKAGAHSCSSDWLYSSQYWQSFEKTQCYADSGTGSGSNVNSGLSGDDYAPHIPGRAPNQPVSWGVNPDRSTSSHRPRTGSNSVSNQPRNPRPSSNRPSSDTPRRSYPPNPASVARRKANAVHSVQPKPVVVDYDNTGFGDYDDPNETFGTNGASGSNGNPGTSSSGSYPHNSGNNRGYPSNSGSHSSGSNGYPSNSGNSFRGTNGYPSRSNGYPSGSHSGSSGSYPNNSGGHRGSSRPRGPSSSGTGSRGSSQAVKPSFTPIAGPVDDYCLDCICYASSKCDVNKQCTSSFCGPYLISWAFWADGGKPGGDYATCAVDKKCSESAVQGYMTKWQKDCNGDGVIDCTDFAAIHKFGPYACGNSNTNTGEYWTNFNSCANPSLDARSKLD